MKVIFIIFITDLYSGKEDKSSVTKILGLNNKQIKIKIKTL